jgi:hypothetical protein
MTMTLPALTVVAAIGAAASCASVTEIGTLDPRPRLESFPTGHAYDLVVEAGVPDSFEVPGYRRLHARVISWRATLTRAFEAAGGGSGDRAAKPARLAVTIERADLIFVSADEPDEGRSRAVGLIAWAGDDDQLPVILAHGSHSTPKVSAPRAPPTYAKIVYAATLRSADGEVLCRARDSIRSTRSADRSAALSAVVREGVEIMFQSMLSSLLPCANAPDR